jgi:4-carboxymuconolactone decarboxylase
MDEKLFEKGMEKRKKVLGKDYTENVMANTDDLNDTFQKAMTEWCWGFGWGDETIDMKTRSMMNLTMIAALGKMHEWELHCHGALKNGVSKEEIRSILHVIGIYCGVPQAMECFRVAKKVFDEKKA